MHTPRPPGPPEPQHRASTCLATCGWPRCAPGPGWQSAPATSRILRPAAAAAALVVASTHERTPAGTRPAPTISPELIPIPRPPILDSPTARPQSAFRVKARELHPDVSKDPLSACAFMECQSAYQTLLDPEARAKYDRTLVPKASSQALSYLNARSAARHGVRTPRAPVDVELHKTMLELLSQVKSCTSYLEREFLSGGGASGQKAGASSSSSARTAAPARPAVAVSPVVVSPVMVEDASDCEHGECAEPWLYYAVVQESSKSAAATRRRV